jgi:hypothetical protein
MMIVVDDAEDEVGCTVTPSSIVRGAEDGA